MQIADVKTYLLYAFFFYFVNVLEFPHQHCTALRLYNLATKIELGF